MIDPGNLTYAQAVAAGLYPEYTTDASKALTTYSPIGPPIAPRFGEARSESQIIEPAQRS